jgi:hypothetical protein
MVVREILEDRAVVEEVWARVPVEQEQAVKAMQVATQFQDRVVPAAAVHQPWDQMEQHRARLQLVEMVELEHQVVIQDHHYFMPAAAVDQLKTHQRFLAMAVRVLVEMVAKETTLCFQQLVQQTQAAAVEDHGLGQTQQQVVRVL